MKIWKPLSEFKKPRDETGFHADFALEPGEGFYLLFGPPAGGIELQRVCPEGRIWKVHFALAIEEFEEGD